MVDFTDCWFQILKSDFAEIQSLIAAGVEILPDFAQDRRDHVFEHRGVCDGLGLEMATSLLFVENALNNINRLNGGRPPFDKSLSSFLNASFIGDSNIFQLINLFNFCSGSSSLLRVSNKKWSSNSPSGLMFFSLLIFIL